MANRKNKPVKHRIFADISGKRYRFFCDVSGAAVYTTKPIMADTQEEELMLAWQEARQYFNRCSKCGRYVCDTMYNADVCECVDCSPWEAKPNYCKKCGSEISDGSIFCGGCGNRARYGEVWGQ